MPGYLDRQRLLAAVLKAEGATAFIATTPVTMGYFAGFSEGGGERLMALILDRDQGVRLFCPALSVNQARRCGIECVQGFADGEDPSDAIRASGLRGTVAVEDEMLASILLRFQGWLPDVEFIAGSRLAGQVMRCKSADELEILFRAGGMADAAYRDVVSTIRAGESESAVGGRLETAMAAQGGKPMFAIVATGANGAEPHHHTDETILKEGEVLIMDFGCETGGYMSDITRTVAVGEPDPEADKVYRVVYDAHMAAREVIRPGVTAGEVDGAARRVISDAGYGEFFVHRTGHGLGMRVHEEPYIMPGSDEMIQEGDCFSIEPGIYLPGRFGVRIENIVTCTADGHRSFNAEPSAELVRVG
ncbi:MAG: aminopeptidase P family protein [Armatimonadetes bacterium]|nr:aminopeptidase P family protein [Armatimonadota bacterium]MBX3108780.1 aminopeptidase P family protein [Fimbriimonadaceae bacterium]